MKLLRTTEINFEIEFEELLQRGAMDMDHAAKIVSIVIGEVKRTGDDALIEGVAKFDGWEPRSYEELQIKPSLMSEAYEGLDEKSKEALNLAYKRIYDYCQKQLPKSWIDFEKNGNILGQKVTPVDRAGLYIPGGKAAYPSSVLMNAIPAIVAGVEEIIVCTPTPNNEINPLLLAALHLCNIKKAYKVGGAYAVAAMAYGTKTINKTDVITGPGNIFVATAKKMVFGEVNIDMIAGPSEIGILADDKNDERHIAIDLLSQAEHDEMASSILITDDESFAKKVIESVYEELSKLDREKIARESIEKRGAVIVTKNMDEAVGLMNKIAPEHLEVMTQNPFELLPKIKHAGAIFLGKYTPEAIGDYIAGPNHTLPTGGTARFYSPLSVENFLKKSSIISFSKEGLQEIGEQAMLIASIEGLGAHEGSIRVRID